MLAEVNIGAVTNRFNSSNESCCTLVNDFVLIDFFFTFYLFNLINRPFSIELLCVLFCIH